MTTDTTVKPVTAATLARAKRDDHKMIWLTAYDAASARLADEAGADVLLVGDSLGMVCLGYDSTIPVTLEEMIHHTAAVVRGRRRAWVVCDLPFGTYQLSPEQAFGNAVRVLQQSACDAVKLEGGEHMAATIRFLSERGIAVVAHIGLTPQSVKKFGSYGRRGKSADERAQLLKDAQAVCEAGAVALVLENIPHDLASEITANAGVPTVGIGAGPDCDAQVLVWHDLLGLSDTNPPFAPAYTNARQVFADAISRWGDDVRQGRFPG
ncbi:MAG: 3-methyl-2-oxobutanoate hydroxymethyltransferase [Zetaproteobacteria bacterium CG06_land_8_20_14_3_00_59_53]|nr:MAG: 3-methyl-2-oxobutanoate hydroxymethyltransferase [Zetaproteobacteria bacterium CG2_30_59_37]PIO89321.1 MAG: 3-methyl-2-oxobutanoate hydroxymethyltransferase [Zetaproteobacteria bacterium CG23_combo_of_CG06-09_8_20_14_all_59_86]PIQ65603.1 MAG: 3-methyl-2-oxobutanoate hydroxymethyltransferase [Zetaproteobacteria bacterium CG11_big_fil_rev_8_21_14_0_20_59_439]PIU70620.1 MAG: 3-methyl-2-oxobutanoate hydroxymethyltransferase [Zetaproteobacteria bacterium CG06_land_8_20_14_3_00_59_53]PIU98112